MVSVWVRGLLHKQKIQTIARRGQKLKQRTRGDTLTNADKQKFVLRHRRQIMHFKVRV